MGLSGHLSRNDVLVGIGQAALILVNLVYTRVIHRQVRKPTVDEVRGESTLRGELTKTRNELRRTRAELWELAAIVARHMRRGHGESVPAGEILRPARLDDDPPT